MKSKETRRNSPGCYFFAFFGIPGAKEGDITGHDRDNK
nr:MAG TPA: Tamulustoxin family protein [Bacteriophage sp.]